MCILSLMIYDLTLWMTYSSRSPAHLKAKQPRENGAINQALLRTSVRNAKSLRRDLSRLVRLTLINKDEKTPVEMAAFNCISQVQGRSKIPLLEDDLQSL